MNDGDVQDILNINKQIDALHEVNSIEEKDQHQQQNHDQPSSPSAPKNAADLNLLKDIIPDADLVYMEPNELNEACDQIQIDKSSMNESEIERNLENYDCRQYKGIHKERERVMYPIKKTSYEVLGKVKKSSDENVDVEDYDKFKPIAIKRKQEFK